MSSFDLPEVLAILSRTPAVLDALLRGVGGAWDDARTEGPGSFSPRDVLGHMIAGERHDWIPRARMILEQGESAPFAAFDRFGFRRDLAEKTTDELLDELAAMRRANLAALAGFNLGPADFEKRGRHPAFGPVTLAQLLATWVVHDLGHIAQATRVMAKRGTEAVGPWIEYLPVLTRPLTS